MSGEAVNSIPSRRGKMSSKKFEREEMIPKSEQRSDYLWCLHCERAYKYGEYREVEQYGEILQMCPYEGCDGDTVLDAWDWAKIRDANPTYPGTPEKGKVYPQYGF